MKREIALAVSCPECGADISAPCVGRRGPRKSYHAARYDVAKEQVAPIAKPNPLGYVYFIRCDKTRLLKIGFSIAYPTIRLRQLQTGSGGQLRLLGFIRARAKRERELHKQFAEQRERGEWFRLEGEFAEWFAELVQ